MRAMDPSTTTAPPETARLLEALLSATGHEVDEATVATAVELSRSEASDGDVERLAAAALRTGLALATRRGLPAELARRAGPGAPVVLWGQTPLMVLDHDGRRATTAWGTELERLDDASLGRRLGVRSPTETVAATFAHATGMGHAEASHDPRARVSPFARLRRLLRAEHADVRAIVLLSLGVSVLTLATPIAADQLVGSVAFGGLLQPIIVLSVLLLGCLALAGALRALQSHVAELVQRRIFVHVFADLVHRLPRADRKALEGLDAPELVNRFYDVVILQKGLALLLVDTFALVLSAVVGLIVLAFYHPILLALDIALIASVLGIVFVLGRGGIATSVEESYAKHAIVAFLERVAARREALGTVAAREQVRVHGEARARAYLGARARHWSVVLRQTVSALALQAVGGTVVLALGGTLVLGGSLTLGQLVAAEIVVTVVLGSVAKLGKHLESFYDLVAAADKVGHHLDLPEEPLRSETLAGSGPIRVGSPVLDVAPGERVALVGRSGSGKSRLLARLAGAAIGEDPVALDGVPVGSLDAESTSAVVAHVTTDVLLVGDTILDNVRMGRASVSPARAREALRKVGLASVVDHLSGGLLTPLGSAGQPLSRGQLLRLGLARAIAGAPRLLLIDGVLEHLDRDTRRTTLECLLAPDAPWTLVCATTEEVAPAFPRTVTLGGKT
jgi:ABC-type bacteriocin/lantibiotic exporter with double-glycine peptidase domain